jgi:phenylalanyl-tRNA synthetase beta chain
MICSAKELGLGQDHGGILVLPPDAPLGEDLTQTLSLDDAVLDIEVTPNRPDALSHWGVARELAAILGKKMRLPDLRIPKTRRMPGLVQIQEPALCSRYIGRVVEGVQVRPSPLKTRLRLERCGIRPINNIVDVTNYVLLEFGHPLHAFDRDHLEEGRVVVRRARTAESLLGLDGVERPLADALVIADADKPAALAGIMGGEPSAVRESTRNILLESACFNPQAVRRTARVQRMSTESSYRFERGTDWDVSDWAGRRAAHLILALAGGRLAGEMDLQAKKPTTSRLRVRPGRINQLLGTDASPASMKDALTRLGFQCRGTSRLLSVTRPPHRRDVREEADVAEEVGRLVGYGTLTRENRGAATPGGSEPSPENPTRRLAAAGRSFLVGAGFFEAKGYGLVARDLWNRLAPGAGDPVELGNPLSLSGEFLAPSLLVNLLGSLERNLRHGNKNVRLFEISRAFHRADTGVRENLSLAWLAQGHLAGNHWKFKPRPLEIWDAKAWAKGLLLEWRVAGVRFSADQAPAWLHPGESQAIWVGENRVGAFGRLHPGRAEAWGVPADTFVAEMDLTALAGERFVEPRYEPLPKHQSLFRDLSLVFPETAAWSAVALHVARMFPLVERVELFDVFADPSLPPGHKSLAFRLTFRHPDRTLTDPEAADLQQKILESLGKQFQARLRAAPAAPAAGASPASGEAGAASGPNAPMGGRP